MRGPEAALGVGVDGRFMTDRYPGVGRYVYNLLRAMPAQEVELTIAIDREVSCQTRFDLPALARPGLRLVPVPGRPRSPLGWLGLRPLVRAPGLAAFHFPHFFSACRRRGASVVTVFDVTPARQPGVIPTRAGRLAFAVGLRRALATSDLVITVSHASRRDLVERFGVGNGKVRVTPLAADPSLGRAPRAAVASLSARLGLPDRYALSLGADRPHKNLVKLVDAWLRLPPSVGRGWALVLAGPSDSRFPALRRRVAAAGRRDLVLLDYVPERDLAALYTGASLFVHPSLWEGFGLTVLEAMACGVPVVCSNAEALLEVAGGAAVHFTPDDTEAIASALGQALSDADLRADLARRGCERARTFSWAATAKLTLDVYREAAAARASG